MNAEADCRMADTGYAGLRSAREGVKTGTKSYEDSFQNNTIGA
jgi:hypothetical protein